MIYNHIYPQLEIMINLNKLSRNSNKLIKFKLGLIVGLLAIIQNLPNYCLINTLQQLKNY